MRFSRRVVLVVGLWREYFARIQGGFIPLSKGWLTVILFSLAILLGDMSEEKVHRELMVDV